MMGNFKIPGKKGFTLVELMVVVAIISIVAAVAVPLTISAIPRYRLRAAVRELVIDFKKAKLEAVKRNRDVLLEFTLETVGNPNAGGSYQVCEDSNSSGACDAGETLKVINMPRNIRLTGTTFANNRAGYTPRGLPWSNNFGTVTIRTSDGARSYGIALASAGRVQLQ